MSAPIPSRMSAWSSTVRTRIGLGSVIILGLLPIRSPSRLSRKPESATCIGFAIRNAGRNDQLDFRPSSLFAPDFQVPAKRHCAFAHTRQAPVSRASAPIANSWVDSTSVVAHLQPKLRNSIGNFRLDFFRLRMAERVSQRLAGNSVDFIAKYGIEFLLFSLH